MKSSSQGKSFYAFWEFLLAREMQSELEELIEKCSHNEYIAPTSLSEPEPKYVTKVIKLQSNDKYKSFKADCYVKNLSEEVYFNRAIFRRNKRYSIM